MGLYFFFIAIFTYPFMRKEVWIVVKKILKELIRWVIITLIIGAIIWTTSSLYHFIRNKVKGR